MHDQSHTTIGVTKTAVYFLYAILAIIGLTIGYFIPQFAKWALSLPWIPFEGLLRLVTSFHGSPAAFITALLGMSAGLWFAHTVMAMLLSVKITDDTVELIKGKNVQTIRSADIALVFIDHKRLVLLGTAGYELVREEIDEKPGKVEKAFRQHHYEWAADGDPFKDQFRRWIPDAPDLSPGAHALLKARHKALKGEETDDVEEFRLELAQLGIVVRDEGTRQYWRKAATYQPNIQHREGS
ncbi:YqeB [Bacillus tequilensis]|nr:YqeB [Bacillus tequilensis]